LSIIIKFFLDIMGRGKVLRIRYCDFLIYFISGPTGSFGRNLILMSIRNPNFF